MIGDTPAEGTARRASRPRTDGSRRTYNEPMLIPISDENPTRRFPLVTIVLVMANVAVFAYEASLTPEALQTFVAHNAFVPAALAADPFSPAVWRTVLTAMFLHGGWVHVGGNMLYLWIFGNNIEDRLGAVRFAGFYLLCGVLATLAQFIAAPGTTIPNLGASGAVAGVLGSYLLLYPRAVVVTIIPLVFFFSVERLSALLVIGFWFVLQLANGIASLGSALAETGGVAWFAHLGGFAAGLVLTLPVWRADRSSRRRWA